MPRCNRAHRDWRLFVATNGIVHILHCNPRLRPRKEGGGGSGGVGGGGGVVTGHQSFDEHMDGRP